jgi:1-acyl-sn-glycerol-3-phosphate acyltransferase
MSRVWQSILSLWAWLVLVLCILIWFPLLIVVRLLTAPFDPGRYATGYLFRRIGPVMASLNPLWRFRYSGIMPQDPRRPFVVVSNHESFADILLISHLPWEMKWLSKAELFRIPVMGWMMWLAGDIPVKRGFGPSAVEAMERCRDVLRKRVSVMIFPEGTRSKTSELLPFKDGAFPAHSAWPSKPVFPSSRWQSPAPGPRSRSMGGGSVVRRQRCACSSRWRRPG